MARNCKRRCMPSPLLRTTSTERRRTLTQGSQSQDHPQGDTRRIWTPPSLAILRSASSDHTLHSRRRGVRAVACGGLADGRTGVRDGDRIPANQAIACILRQLGKRLQGDCRQDKQEGDVHAEEDQVHARRGAMGRSSSHEDSHGRQPSGHPDEDAVDQALQEDEGQDPKREKCGGEHSRVCAPPSGTVDVNDPRL